jgi:hypothetical protein
MDASFEFTKSKRVKCFMAMAAIVTSLMSCEPSPLDVDSLKIPDTGIVINSMILRDSSVAVLVTQSMRPLQATDEADPRKLIASVAINDATVSVTANGLRYNLALWRDGVYKSTDIPLIPGRQYDLDVVSKSFGQASATTILQPPVALVSATATPAQSQYNTRGVQVGYSLYDPPGSNHYLVAIQRPKHESDIDLLLLPMAYTHAIDDKAFNDTEFSETFIATTKDLLPGDTVEVSLSNVSADYYDYVVMRMENQLKLAELFSEPVYYPSNIRGGRGFFTLYLSDVKVMVL